METATQTPAPAAPPPAPPPSAPPPAAAAAPTTPPPAAPPPAAPPAAAAPAAAAPQTPPAPEPKAAPAAPAPPTTDPAKAAPAPVADFELKLPENKYDPTAIGELKKVMADDKLTPAQRAQAVIDLNERQAAAAAKQFADRAEKMRLEEAAAVKADPVFGGAKYEKTVADARSLLGMVKFGPAASKLLAASGLDNHPDLVRAFAEIRSFLSEDKTRGPGAPPAEVKQPGQGGQTASLIARRQAAAGKKP